MNAPLPKQTGAAVFPDQPARADVIAFDGVSKVFPPRSGSAAVVAVDAIELSVPEGAIVGVIGKSGAGKSTLIRLINGLEQPTSGHVRVYGTDMAALDM